MEKKTRNIEVKRDGRVCYRIWLEPDFGNLPAALKELGTEKKKLCIVTDTTVAERYAGQLQEVLQQCCNSVSLFVFPAGEEHKTLDTVKKLYEHLILEQYDRKDMLVALGGGVVGDLTGFTAATYLRGIDFIQVPTTLLSQVDSSIGGKTGVDFDAYKNMVGAFHMPRLVYMNLGVLKSLPKRQFSSGMAEIIKHGLIQDSEYYDWLGRNCEKIRGGEYEAILHMVGESCRIKQHIVEKDPTEHGIRAWLNFGHTAGHAIEKLKDFSLSHGECVAIGCAAAAWLSWKRGKITEEACRKAEQLLKAYGLPTRAAGLVPEDILKTTKLDKKMEAGKIKFILLRQIGEAYVAKDVSDEELLQAIRYVCGESFSDEEKTE
ncbi:MAG: 3-dehydroquinate synthase [Lachnospiraceae bacterium]|jgi:3-dehydroquinate synthase|nr:3-dehydroquinate synthase [Lachnospiraceae bacterium]MCI9600442.1 3-dehydroquinate synthase [Lachnospiraceae bacterium]